VIVIRVKSHIGVSIHSERELSSAEEIVKSFNLKFERDRSSIPIDFRVGIVRELYVHVDDQRFKPLIDEFKKSNVDYLELREWEFSEEELRNAEYLDMHPAGYWGYPQPESSYQEKSYDLSTACSKPRCGRGARQIKPFFIKGIPKFGKNDILAINWEYEFLITDRLKTLIKGESLTGAEFWPLFNLRKPDPIKGFHQLYVKNELPPMSSNSKLTRPTADGIPLCSCDFSWTLPRFHPSGPVSPAAVSDPVCPPVYNRKSLENAMDFNKTAEFLGAAWGGTQNTIVSRRVFELFAKNNIRQVKFKPIIIET